jgi:protein involved in polysaccharide export with SLBB domain
MKQILILGVVCASISAQALDINDFRLNQTQLLSMDKDQPAVKSENQSSMTIQLEQPIIKDKYRVGPGDRFKINIISSDNVNTYSLVVSPTGELLIPTIGVTNVYGKTLSRTILILEQLIHDWNQSAKVHIILAGIRKFKIKVVGHLNNPGYFTATPVSRVSDIFKTISGDPRISNLTKRNIKLVRGNDTLFVDLVKFGVTGNTRYNPFIQQGDILIFSLKESFVGLYGGIRTPGDYEFVPNETLEELISLAGGFKINAIKNKIEFTRFVNATEKQTSYIDYEQSNKIIVEPEDHFMVRFTKDYKRKKIVTIEGEVHFPGNYSIDENTTLSDIIDRSGGFTNWADPSHIRINNEIINSISDREKKRILIIPEENRSIPERAYIKARSLTRKGTIESNSITQMETLLKFKMVKDDQIIVPQSHDFVELVGGIMRPGRYPFYSDKTVKDYILLAGGKNETSIRSIFIIKSGTGQRIPAKKNTIIENGDTIFIPEKMEYNSWIVLKDIFTALGQVAALIIVIQNAIGN